MRSMNNSRALIIILFLFISFVALVVRLVNIQLINGEEYKYFAQKQQTGVEKIDAELGLIYDRNNNLLAYNNDDVSFFVDLRMISQRAKEDIAIKFSKVMGKSKNFYLNQMRGKGKTICLERKVPSDKANRLKDFKRTGLFFREDPSRVNHYGSLASHLLGYFNTERKAISGISEFFQETLQGIDGVRRIEKNAIGDLVSIEESETEPAIPGSNLITTIDKRFQLILEEELKNGLKEYGGSSATGIIMDPNSGQVLALANINDFDPNSYWLYNDFQRRNRAITDTYEPGSTFKPFTVAALIDKKLCSLNENVNVENGNYKFKNVRIKDTHPYSSLNVVEIIEQSSNIGIAKLSQRIGDDDFYKYLRGFGFGNLTSVSLPGETAGKLKKPNSWSKISKAYMSFGYEISVTPLQLITAFSALINGGLLYQPQLILKQVSHDGQLENEFKEKAVRRVISENTSDVMRSILRGVVKNGTGKKAGLDFITVGGKTGTSQKLIDGNYSKQHYNSSFIGFYPVENPKIVCLILVNSPDVGKYGGLVAAPIFKKVTERIVQNDYDEFEKYIRDDFKQKLQFADLSDENETTSNSIVEVSYKELKHNSDNLMPDLKNSSLRDAINLLTKMGVKYKINGNGIVVEQSIPAGYQINSTSVCILNCSEITVKGASLY